MRKRFRYDPALEAVVEIGSDMIPGDAFLDAPYMGARDGIGRHNFANGSDIGANCQYFSLRKACAAVLITLWARASALGFAIRHIVFGRSEPQVFRIDAGGSVASMQHMKADWNRPIGALPRKTVRPSILGVPRHHAVAAGVLPSSPQNAAIGLPARGFIKPLLQGLYGMHLQASYSGETA